MHEYAAHVMNFYICNLSLYGRFEKAMYPKWTKVNTFIHHPYNMNIMRHEVRMTKVIERAATNGESAENGKKSFAITKHCVCVCARARMRRDKFASYTHAYIAYALWHTHNDGNCLFRLFFLSAFLPCHE